MRFQKVLSSLAENLCYSDAAHLLNTVSTVSDARVSLIYRKQIQLPQIKIKFIFINILYT